MTLQYTALYMSSLVYATKVFSHTMTCACAKCEGERRVIIVHIGCTHILLQLESMALYVFFFLLLNVILAVIAGASVQLS